MAHDYAPAEKTPTIAPNEPVAASGESQQEFDTEIALPPAHWGNPIPIQRETQHESLQTTDIASPDSRTGRRSAGEELGRVVQEQMGMLASPQVDGASVNPDSSRQQPIQKKENKTGMPDNLKSGIENLSGFSMDDVKVHYDSSNPAQLQAHAYAQGSNIHLAPGQEDHLPHEAWHVAQQKQGNVNPTKQLKGKVNINDDAGLEKEADIMGARALRNANRDQSGKEPSLAAAPCESNMRGVVQRTKVEEITTPNAESMRGQPEFSATVIQAASVTTVKRIPPGSHVPEGLLQKAIAEVQQIVATVDAAQGQSRSGTEHQRLETLLKHQNVQGALPSSSNATFGVGGANYFGTAPITTTQGPKKFGEAVAGVPNVGQVAHLGNRPTGTHDEMHHLQQRPGLEALASSQGHCFFCFGTLHQRGYQHGKLRADPWPQMWTHDYMGFQLAQTNEYQAKVQAGTLPAIQITSDLYGTRYYFVNATG